MVEGEEIMHQAQSALAILSCRPNSHPFQERHISLHEPVKIGRSVAKARPSASNGIFDCKVLSRHHAVLWYENGKFYLQDTKSSNGTFVDNQRLCKGGEESPAQEIFSGSIVQFGVEVVENNRRGERITHGCIIATISLYHPDGREAKPDSFLTGERQPGIALQTQDLYHLAHYLQEALNREKMLEQKLITLQQLVCSTQEAAESGWQALIDEDKLLSRLEMLENRLHIYSKNHSEDSLRQELQALQEDKDKYETTSKESLRRVLQEKLEAVTKLSDLEQSLGSVKDECSHLKAMCEFSQRELGQLAVKYQEQLKQIADLEERLQVAEFDHATEFEKVQQEKAEITQKLEEVMHEETSLNAKIQSLQTDENLTKEQLTALKAKLESVRETNEEDHKINLNGQNISDSELEEVDILSIGPSKDDDIPENLEAKLKELQKLIETYRSKLEYSDAKVKESQEKVECLQKDLEIAVSKSKDYQRKIATLEDKIKLSDFHMNEMVESALHNLKLQLKESTKQSDSSNDWIETMKDHIHLMEKELTLHTPVNSAENSTESLEGDNTAEPDSSSPTTCPPASPKDSLISTKLVEMPPDLLHSAISNGSKEDAHIQKQDAITVLTETSDTSAKNDDDKTEHSGVEIVKDEIFDLEGKFKKTDEEMSSLQAQLFDAQQQAKEKADIIKDLQEEVRKAQSSTQDVRQQILDLKEQLENERARNKITERELGDTKDQLATSQQNLTSHDESEEYQAVKKECAILRTRIQVIEAEIKQARQENLHLSSEYNKLQESYKHLVTLKVKFESSEDSSQCNLTDSQKDEHGVRLELAAAVQELSQLKQECERKSEIIGSLQKQLIDMASDYHALRIKSHLISLASSIPLLMLLFAILMVIYPTLEAVTSTLS